MTDDTILPFSFSAVHAKKVTAAFDGGRLNSNGGVMLLAMAERRRTRPTRTALSDAGYFAKGVTLRLEAHGIQSFTETI